MSFSSPLPVAITGAGLLCRSQDAACLPPASRFISLYQQIPITVKSRSRAEDLAINAAVSAFGRQFINGEHCGAVVTISKGLVDALENDIVRLKHALPNRPDDVDLEPISQRGPDAAAIKIARSLRLGGPAAAGVAACASGLVSIKLGMDWLRDGVCETVLAGAAESSNSELILRSFERLGVISASGYTRPFDALRDGFVAGEGAAVFRLEKWSAAKSRAERGQGPAIIGKISGIAFGADGHHLTTPDLSGEVLIQIIHTALDYAGLKREDIGWVHAHGTGTAYNDPVEISALRGVFENSIPPVTATKGATGHLLGASGVVAMAMTLNALRGNFIPSIAGLRLPSPEFKGIDFVRTRRPSPARNALVLNHGFGGHIAAVIVSV